MIKKLLNRFNRNCLPITESDDDFAWEGYCSNCKTELELEFDYCPGCGKKIRWDIGE